jgi:hypothetical protein
LTPFIKSFYIFAPIFAIIGGTCQGALIILPLYCTWRYFPIRYKKKVSGIILCSYAVAPLITSFFARMIINPQNLKPDLLNPIDSNYYFSENVSNNLIKFFRLFGISTFVVGFTGVLMITEPLTQE